MFDMSPNKPVCGLDHYTINDIKSCLSIASENAFSFIRGPIINPRNIRDVTDPDWSKSLTPLTRMDLVLSSQDWMTMVIGKISDWLDCDSVDVDTVRRSEAVLLQELAYASHLGLFAITFPLHGLNHVNLARIISGKFLKPQIMFQAYVQVPVVSKKVMASSHRRYLIDEVEDSTWHWWKKFHLLCGSDRNLGVLLEMTADLPPASELDRWLGEPIRGVLLPTSIFLTNKKGFPVLSQAHQIFLRKVSSVCSRVILSGANRHQALKHYVKYINYIFEMGQPLSGMVTPYSHGFEDHLQVPLQPLMDNLESTTYETFEKDPVKYTEYFKAIKMALQDRTKDAPDKYQVIMVVGAGRGPLVTASLEAAEKAEVRVKVYAVEKNPNAYVTLCSFKEEVWKDKVELVNCDMRFWQAPEKCDILVSELLGSFGDNELSPECLDGAQKFLKDDGVSIPCKYTSYLKPIQSSKLFNEVHGFSPTDRPKYTVWESPYVVHQINTYSIAKHQPVFTFVHPKAVDSKNDRASVLKFEVKQDAVLHGFSGYFDTVLYKDVMLSIVPENLSKGMFSWFPMYFPIKAPINLKKGDTLVVHMWRLSDAKQVWYEWCISEPVQSEVHNLNGRSYTIGLY